MNIEWAKFSHRPKGLPYPRCRGRRRQGLLYEQRVQEHFRKKYPLGYVASPWLKYKLTTTKVRYAQPDGLFVDVPRGLIVVCEIKYQHTPRAYWQLLDKYVPLIEFIFGAEMWRVAACEIVKWYDCAVDFPTQVTLHDSITAVRPGEFGVHIWKP